MTGSADEISSSISGDAVQPLSNARPASVRAAAVNGYAARLRVVRAGLGGDAPLIGAAALVHRRDLL